jgi:3-deoxy-D-manno-octulosonate 8-phosphate phosphatase (KDO 8-P phosphatase)
MMGVADTIADRAIAIKLVISDVDGVLTDGRLYFAPTGEEHKVFHVHDGLGIKLLRQANIEFAVISSRNSPIVAQRMQNLGVNHIYQGQVQKLPAFESLLTALQLPAAAVAYIGDDLPDLPIIRRVGLGICVANAHSLLKRHAHWQTQAKGGKGAIREVCDFILNAQGKLENLYAQYL